MIQKMVNKFATVFARGEERAHPSAVILPDFPRVIQLDRYSCGAKSLYAILRFYRKRCTIASVEEVLETDEDGTSVSDIKRVVKRYGLTCKILRKPGIRDLEAAIDDECPVLITLYDDEHYSVVYGYSRTHIFVMNPSLDFTEDGVGSISCAIPKDQFRKTWDRWALVVHSVN